MLCVVISLQQSSGVRLLMSTLVSSPCEWGRAADLRLVACRPEAGEGALGAHGAQAAA